MEYMICINNDEYTKTLVVGKKYKINIRIGTNMVDVFDNQRIGSFFKDRFITLQEYEILHRKDKINNILNDDRRFQTNKNR